MKMPLRNILRFAALGAIAALVGVAGLVQGGGGATGTGGPAYAAFGRLTDFGSIFVNGIEFFTDKASITINGVPNRPESDLRIGMVLSVTGSLNGSGTTGNAATVDYHADALGMVDVAPVQGDAGGSFGVLGQAIATDERTVFAGVIGVTDLRVGDFVEVSGYPTASGVLASRVERKTSVPTVQVQGAIGNVGTSGTTFTLGALTVDYGIATLKNLPPGGFAEGQTVVVNGPTPVNGVLTASSVEVIVLGVSGNTNGSVAGIISSATANAIVVNGQSLAVTSSTQYVNGTAADLAVGTLVKVDYTVMGGNALATRIEFTKLDTPSFVEADVTATGPGFVELLGPGGVIVTVNAATQLRDGSDAKVQTLTLGAINVGDHLQVNGNQVGEDVVLATSIVRSRPSTVITLQGRALSAAAPVFTVVDVAITVTSTTDLRNGSGPPPSSADDFFARVAGRNVTVSAVRQGGAIVATRVQLD